MKPGYLTKYQTYVEKIRTHPAGKLQLYHDLNKEPQTFVVPTDIIDVTNLFEHIELRMPGEHDFFGRRLVDPSMCLYPAVRLTEAGPMRKVGMFTMTSKMACPSWSMPFGPPRMGGTCVFSDVEKASKRLTSLDPKHKGTAGSAGRFICLGCYASSGNYGVFGQQLLRAVRKVWTQRALDDKTFVDSMVESLRVYNSTKHKHPETKQWQDPNYFRIHDSGDMLWGGKEYFDGWCSIAEAMPDIMFWAPTRDWPSPKMQQWAANRPSNFVLRPSALHFEEPVPLVEGMDAGTGVSFTPAAYVKAGKAKVNCPAYDSPVLAHTCTTMNCRRCWEEPKSSVCYKAHKVSPKVLNNPSEEGEDEQEFDCLLGS